MLFIWDCCRLRVNHAATSLLLKAETKYFLKIQYKFEAFDSKQVNYEFEAILIQWVHSHCINDTILYLKYLGWYLRYKLNNPNSFNSNCLEVNNRIYKSKNEKELK